MSAYRAALLEAAAEQRRLASESRTNNGEAEHTDFADWLEERAEQLATEPADATERIAEVLYAHVAFPGRTPYPSWDRAYPIVRRPYLELAEKVLALTTGGQS